MRIHFSEREPKVSSFAFYDFSESVLKSQCPASLAVALRASTSIFIAAGTWPLVRRECHCSPGVQIPIKVSPQSSEGSNGEASGTIKYHTGNDFNKLELDGGGRLRG